MKSPVIISIASHLGECYIEEVNERLSEYGGEGKVLALGALKSYMEWDSILKHAEGIGMKVVYIDSNFASKIINSWIELEKAAYIHGIPKATELKEQGIFEEVMKEIRMREAKHEYIIRDLRNRSIVRKVRKEEPDIVVCNAFHAEAITEEIPVEEHIQIGEYDEMMRYCDSVVRGRIDWMLKERERAKREGKVAS